MHHPGKPVLFVHGFFHIFVDLPAPMFFAPRLALVPDLLGYGTRAGVPVSPINLEAQVDELASKIRSACSD